MLAAVNADMLCNPELFRQLGTYEDGVIPSQFCDRLRKLLQPTVVRKTTVENSRIGCKSDFQLGRCRGRLRNARFPSRIDCQTGPRLGGSAYDTTVMQRAVPASFEVAR